MIQRLHKNGLQKGQYLSIDFFQKQISESLSKISRRIRDVIHFEEKRNWQKKTILPEQQYLRQLYHSYSLNFQSNYKQDQKININDNNVLKIIDLKFISEYPLFFEPKWKIYFEGEPSVRQLAVLNHLAYGYFYEKSQQGETVCLLKIKYQGIYTHTRCEKGMQIEFGTAKILDVKSSQFNYVDYILYNCNECNKNSQGEDPRKVFDRREAIVEAQPQVTGKKKSKIIYMTPNKLQEKLQVSLEPYSCFKYRPYKPEPKQIEEHLFKLKTYFWLTQDNNTEEIDNQQDTSTTQINSFMRKNSVNFANSSKLVPFLEKIPNFEYNLSHQQKQLIQRNENVIVIGRSGTGKTTCGLIRLFSLQTMFKVKLVGTKNFKSSDLDKPSQMKNLFLTSSSYLIGKIKNDYEKHQKNVKFQIQKKQGKFKNEDQDYNTKRTILDQEKNDIKIMRNKNSLTNTTCLKNLTELDYPGFFTIQDFLIMLDGIFSQSFLQRDSMGNLKKTLEEDQITFNEKYRCYLRYGKVFSEINYNVFQKDFWNIEIKKRKQLKYNLSPHVVWTQIFSQIKGSIDSHRYPEFFLSQQSYLSSKKNKFLTLEQKSQLYFIFKLYCSWKSQKERFDLMDLVNYMLNKIRKYSYKGPSINYLFIDEVQDITAATIYLLSQIPSNNIYYSGDTAQSIIKGVNFRFSDIRQIFHSQSIFKIPNQEQPTIMPLTVNFRSHNQILKLANCLIKMIQLLFPKAIDSLKKQSSEDVGPSPVVVENEKQIQQILEIGQSSQFKNHNTHAILVRDQKSAEQAKNYFQDALIITIQQSKGSQFNDVVIWRLLQKSKFQKLWKIIQNLEITSMSDMIDFILSDKIKEINIREYQQIFSQIKLLYTAVTRAKDILVIYDSLPDRLKQLLRKLRLFKQYSGNFFEEICQRKVIIKKKLNTIVNEISPWKKLGFRFYAQQNYQKAIICFQKDGDQDMCRQVQAKILVRQGENLIQKLKTRQHQGNKVLQQQKNKKFQDAARIFEDLNLSQEAGKAYYLCQNYKYAIIFFRAMNMFVEMANCYIKLHKYTDAAYMYEKAGRYQKTVEYLRKDKNSREGLLKLRKYKKHILEVLGGQEYKKQKQEMQGQIFQSCKIQVEQQNNSQIRIKQNNNLWAFYEFNLNFYHNDEQIQANQAKQYLKNVTKLLQRFQKYDHKEEVLHQNDHMILIENNLIQKDVINNLKMVLLFDQDCSLKSFDQFILQPQNIQNMIKRLQNIQSYTLCFYISVSFNLFLHLQEYFMVRLSGRFFPFDNFQQFYKSDKKTEWDRILKKRKQIMNDKIDKQINRFNFYTLRWCQNYINNGFVNNIVQTLILCGFYRSCQVFFRNKSNYYLFFFEDQKFLRQINEEKSSNCFRQQIQFMKLTGWHKKLKMIEIVFICQILFRIYEEIASNKSRKNQKERVLLTNQQNQAEKMQLNAQVQRIRSQFAIKRQNLEKQLQQLKMKTKNFKQQQDSVKQWRKVIVKKKEKLQNQIIFRQNKINQVNKKIQQLKETFFMIKIFKKIDDQIYKHQIQNKFNKRQKQQIQIQLTEQRKNLQIADQHLNKYEKTRNQKQEIQQRIRQINLCEKNKIQRSNYMYEIRLRKMLSSKIKRLISNQFTHLNIGEVSNFLGIFYSCQKLDNIYIRKILNFDVSQTSDSILCQICTFAISLLLNHDHCIESLDLVTGVSNSFQKIIKMNTGQNIHDYELEDEEKIGTIKVILAKYISLIQQFFAKIVFLLQNSQQNKNFFRIFSGFFSCRVFEFQQMKIEILSDYAIIKTETAMIFDLFNKQNSGKISFFDQNYDFLITQKENLSQILVSFLSKKYQTTFCQSLNWSINQYQNGKKQSTKQKGSNNQIKYSKLIERQQNAIETEQNQYTRRRKRFIQRIFFQSRLPFQGKNLFLDNVRQLKKIKYQYYILKNKRMQLSKLKQKQKQSAPYFQQKQTKITAVKQDTNQAVDRLFGRYY